jgi:hypothetical protein
MIAPHVLATVFCTKSISTNRHTDTNETFRIEGDEENVSVESPTVSQRGGSLYDVLCHIEDHAQLGLNVTVIHV